LANGIGGHIKNPTNIIKLILQHELPADQVKDITYRQFVCLAKPKKAEPNQMQFIVGGDRINYPGKVATPATEIWVAKMLFNSVISTKDAQFMTIDISNFYLMTPLHCAKFIRIKLRDTPNEVINKYKLKEKATRNNSIYIRAKHSMYSLSQAGLLANKPLEKCLNKYGYQQSKLVPSLWKHYARPIQFTLVVDNFGVKCIGQGKYTTFQERT
jgi:hypothetical protein